MQELLNYKKVFEFVSKYLEDGGPITEGLVREIHKRLVEGVRGGAAAPGEYRKIQNYVVNSIPGKTIYTPPPAHDVQIMMAELVDWFNQEQEIHPVLMGGISQFQFVHIHSFLDRNGRAPGCPRPRVSTGPDMILSGFLRLASITTETGRPFTWPFQVSVRPGWT